MIAFTTAVYADFYTWEDEAGVQHITDYPPPGNKKSQNIKVYQKSAPPVPGDSQAKAEMKPVITLYTKNDCPECDKAREFFNGRKLSFKEYNLDNDQTAVAKRKEIDNSTDVPFAVINRSQVYGFSETIYDRALKTSP